MGLVASMTEDAVDSSAAAAPHWSLNRSLAIIGASMIATGVAGFIWAPNLVPNAPIALVLVGVLIAFVGVVRLAHERRREDLALALHGLGLTAVFVKSKSDREALYDLWEPFAFLKRLRSGNRGLQWIAWGEREDLTVDGRVSAVRLFEHRYIVQAGHATVAKFHTVSGVVVPDGWPKLQIDPRGVFGGSSGLDFGDAAFDRRFRVRCGDAAFARALLTDEVRAWLVATAKKGERWRVQGSASGCVLACLWPRYVPVRDLGGLVERPVYLAERAEGSVFGEDWAAARGASRTEAFGGDDGE